MENKQIITKTDLNKAFIRSNFLGASWNYEKMQSLGALFMITPILKKIYKGKSKEEKEWAMRRHLEFFNTNPWVYGPIAGITIALEEQTDEEEKDSVISVRSGLMGPFAGLGDSLLALTFMPILLSLTSSLAIRGNTLAPFIYYIVFNLIIWTIKYKGFMISYKKGTSILTGEKGQEILGRISQMGNVLGMMIAGSLIVGMVNINIPLEYTVHDFTVNVQEMLDGIMPGFLPLMLTLLIYKNIKKTEGKNTLVIILSILVIGTILALLGILG